jgi:hypothetical protein
VYLFLSWNVTHQVDGKQEAHVESHNFLSYQLNESTLRSEHGVNDGEDQETLIFESLIDRLQLWL